MSIAPPENEAQAAARLALAFELLELRLLEAGRLYPAGLGAIAFSIADGTPAEWSFDPRRAARAVVPEPVVDAALTVRCTSAFVARMFLTTDFAVQPDDVWSHTGDLAQLGLLGQALRSPKNPLSIRMPTR